MIRISVIAVGKVKEKYFSDACDEYIKRLGAFCKFQMIEIPEYRCPDDPSQAEINTVVENEGKRILDAIPEGSAVIPMCIEGKIIDSVKLSDHIDKTATNGTGSICFIIGGSWGLSESVKSKGTLRLSMSPMTFPHTLARVMLLEQIYRAFSILKGTKYHK